ncbi:unnamed protein product [Closterium sp. NIES-53]
MVEYDPYEIAITDKLVTTMRGRLRAAFPWWSSWCESSFILSVVLNGYWMPWKHGPSTPFQKDNHAGALIHSKFTKQAIIELLESGAAIIAPGSQQLCISPLNVVVQRDKCRLILDLRRVNQSLSIPKFKYEGLKRVAELVSIGGWMFAVDLKSGYHHVDIHPSCWKYLGFQFDGHSYVFRSLPFGLATAPFVFTQLIKQLARRWRALGVRVIPYVDDIIFLCHTEAEARTMCQMVVEDLNKAGLVINSKKSHLQPTQQLRFLGVELDTKHGQFSIGPERRTSLRSTIQKLCMAGRAKRKVPICHVARVTGMLASMSLAIGATARAFSQNLLQTIQEAASWNSKVPLVPAVIEELEFWLQEFDNFNGASFHVPSSYDAVIHVDASAHSWGATLDTFPGGRTEANAAMPERLTRTSSTQRDMEGVLWALQTFAGGIHNRHVLAITDNQVVFFILRKGGSRSPSLTTTCRAIIQTCMASRIRLTVEWILRELNTRADELSKMIDRDDYSIKVPWFHLIEQRLGPHSIDLFANASNTQLARFCSKTPHPDEEATDAFAISWNAEHSYAFPPPHLIPAVLHHAQRTRASLTLVVPHWPGASWWPLLQTTPPKWAPCIRAHIHLTHGSQCLTAGTHTCAFSDEGMPHSPILA